MMTEIAGRCGGAVSITKSAECGGGESNEVHDGCMISSFDIKVDFQRIWGVDIVLDCDGGCGEKREIGGKL